MKATIVYSYNGVVGRMEFEGCGKDLVYHLNTMIGNGYLINLLEGVPDYLRVKCNI